LHLYSSCQFVGFAAKDLRLLGAFDTCINYWAVCFENHDLHIGFSRFFQPIHLEKTIRWYLGMTIALLAYWIDWPPSSCDAHRGENG